jgi:hypothetical protein
MHKIQPMPVYEGKNCSMLHLLDQTMCNKKKKKEKKNTYIFFTMEIWAGIQKLCHLSKFAKIFSFGVPGSIITCNVMLQLGALGLELEKIQKINEEIEEEKQNLQVLCIYMSV